MSIRTPLPIAPRNNGLPALISGRAHHSLHAEIHFSRFRFGKQLIAVERKR